MEQYSMWVKRKTKALMMNPTDESWEEEAFAEDGRGPLGGFVWPPRAYSCSFCRRQFGSAQALGGHMNIHRRERAKLKQSFNYAPPQNPSFNSSPSLPRVSDHNFILGFRLNMTTDHRGIFEEEKVMNFKRQKTTVMPLEEVDLELRLAR